MRGSNSTEHLIGMAYEAALNPTLWEPALLKLSKLADCAGAHLVVVDTRCHLSVAGFLAGDHLAPDLMTRYLQDWAVYDPLVAAVESARAKDLLICTDYVSERAAQLSAFYQEFVIPNGSRYMASWMLAKNNGLAIALTLHSASAPFERPRLRHLNRAAYHIGRAAEIGARLGGEVGQHQLLRRTLDHSKVLCVMVDSQSRVVDQSASAEAFINAGKWFHVDRERRLKLNTAADTRKLTEFVSRCASGAGGGRLYLGRNGEEYPHLEILPAGRFSDNPFHQRHACALIFLRLPRAPRKLSALTVRNALGCTLAEAEVAIALSDGLSPQTIAAQRAVSALTVRTQIRSLRAKTNSSRMSELIALISPLANGAGAHEK